MYRCTGCGIISEKELCDRCFRIRHYNDYKRVNLDFKEVNKLLDEIKEEDLKILVIDLLNIRQDLSKIETKLKSNTILVLAKFDLMPTNNEARYLEYFNKYSINFIDKFCISSKNNYNIDELYESIKNNCLNKKVYFIGFTNAGKSSLINKIIYNYSNIDTIITTSSLPNTTLDIISIKIDSMNLIDTPGIVLENWENSIEDYILKKLHKSKRIKPITYQIKEKQYIVIENIIKLEVEKNDIIIYVPSNLSVKRYYKENDILNDLNYETLQIEKVSDIVIPEIGFVKVMKEGNIRIKKACEIFIRDNLI